MCYEFYEEYYRRADEARKALEAEQKRRQEKPAVPTQPDKGREQAEPVPV